MIATTSQDKPHCASFTFFMKFSSPETLNSPFPSISCVGKLSSSITDHYKFQASSSFSPHRRLYTTYSLESTQKLLIKISKHLIYNHSYTRKSIGIWIKSTQNHLKKTQIYIILIKIKLKNLIVALNSNQLSNSLQRGTKQSLHQWNAA